MRKIVLFVLFMMRFMLVELSSQTQNCLENLNHPNLKILNQELPSGTISREYLLYVPESYEASKPASLVINLHGFGDCIYNYFETVGEFYGFNKLADQENFIVVYPQAAYRIEKEDVYWEPGDNGNDNIIDNDVFFIEELIAEIDTNFGIDLDNVFGCGYSNGGMMAYSLGCNSSKQFSGIGIMSGTMLMEDCIPNESVPLIMFHGVEDEVLPYEGNIWYQSIPEVVNFWLDQYDISPNSNTNSILNNGNVMLDEYSNEDNLSCLSLYTLNEEYGKPAGHVWFSDLIEGTSPSEIMWRFFQSGCRLSSSTMESENSEINIYPNPINENMTIECDLDAEVKYVIIDLSGNVIKDGAIFNNTIAINLSELPSSLYILKIGNRVFKFIKN